MGSALTEADERKFPFGDGILVCSCRVRSCRDNVSKCIPHGAAMHCTSEAQSDRYWKRRFNTFSFPFVADENRRMTCLA